ncbi:unnamed protein product [Prunus armeniaca]
MEIRLVAYERMSGDKTLEKDSIDLSAMEMRLVAYERMSGDTMLENDSIEFVLCEAAVCNGD